MGIIDQDPRHLAVTRCPILQPRSASPFCPDHFCLHDTNTRKLWRSCKRVSLFPIDPWGREICSWGFCRSFQALFSNRVALDKRINGYAHDVSKISSRASRAVLWWTQSADTLKRFTFSASVSSRVRFLPTTGTKNLPLFSLYQSLVHRFQ